MQHEDLQKIKERIANLLKMAADASSPHEAAIAAGRARKLMDKYQIDEFDIAESKEKEFAAVFATDGAQKVQSHVGVLAVAVAKYNDCHARYHTAAVAGSRTRKKTIMFLGYKSDAELAEQMLNRLLMAIDHMCKEYMQKTHGGFVGGVAPEYKRSCTSALCNRLNAMSKERYEIVTTSGNALVVMKEKAVAEHFGETKYRNSRQSQSSDYNAEAARNAGWRDGHKISITEQVN